MTIFACSKQIVQACGDSPISTTDIFFLRQKILNLLINVS